MSIFSRRDIPALSRSSNSALPSGLLTLWILKGALVLAHAQGTTGHSMLSEHTPYPRPTHRLGNPGFDGDDGRCGWRPNRQASSSQASLRRDEDGGCSIMEEVCLYCVHRGWAITKVPVATETELVVKNQETMQGRSHNRRSRRGCDLG